MWEKVSKVGDQDIDSPTAMQASGPMIGWRVKGYDEDSTIDRYQGKLDVFERQAKSSLERELERAGDDYKRAGSAIETYQDVMEDIAKQRVGE